MKPIPKKFLALGDSYTIGEGVTSAERWPDQLAVALRPHGILLAPPKIIAVTGWTSADLKAGLIAGDLEPPYDLVTLLIGVNNQFRAYPIGEYRLEFAELLRRGIDLAERDPFRLIVLSIPDWSVTPFASGRDRKEIARAIDEFNAINLTISRQAGVHYLDVTAISRMAADFPDLLTRDGLHPAGRMYTLWVQRIAPLAARILNQPAGS